jgi:hypothetical protein
MLAQTVEVWHDLFMKTRLTDNANENAVMFLLEGERRWRIGLLDDGAILFRENGEWTEADQMCLDAEVIPVYWSQALGSYVTIPGREN